MGGKSRARPDKVCRGSTKSTAEPRGEAEPTEVSRGHSTSPGTKDWEGPNAEQRMELSDSMSTKRQVKLPFAGTPMREVAAKPQGTVSKPSALTASRHQKLHGTQSTNLMEQVGARDNIVRALKRIEQKKDKAPGIDGCEYLNCVLRQS